MRRKKLSRAARRELLAALRDRYARANKIGKGMILNEFVALSGYNRKYATRILGNAASSAPAPRSKSANRIYDAAVKESLIVLWEASDRICSKRLQAILPSLIDALTAPRTPAAGPKRRQQAPGNQPGVDRSGAQTSPQDRRQPQTKSPPPQSPP